MRHARRGLREHAFLLSRRKRLRRNDAVVEFPSCHHHLGGPGPRHHPRHHHHHLWSNRAERLKSSSSPSYTLSSVYLPYQRLFSSYLHGKKIEGSSGEAVVDVLKVFEEPEQWFPSARARHRRIILHVGPTNSGKTYSALKRLREAERGIYCSPLRLLAWEVADRLMEEYSIPCRLVTGQERTEPPGARHVSCTVEMADISTAFDVAVLDEFQMIGDIERGWAWTRAILGINAAEVHLCGDEAAAPLLRRLCERTGVSEFSGPSLVLLLFFHLFSSLFPFFNSPPPLPSLSHPIFILISPL